MLVVSDRCLVVKQYCRGQLGNGSNHVLHWLHNYCVQTDNDIYAGALADLTKPVRCDSRGSLPNGNIRDHELNQFRPHFRHCQCRESIG